MDNATMSAIIIVFICGVGIGIIGTVLSTVISKNDNKEDNGYILDK